MATYTGGGDILVNTITVDDQYGSYRSGHISALDDGGYVIVWTSESGANAAIKMQRFDSLGNKVGTETLVSTFVGFHILPTVATLNDGTYVVTWTSQNGQDGDANGVYMQRFSALGVALGVETRINTTTAANQDAPYVTALSDGGYIVVWDSQQDGSQYGVYAQRYNASGVAQGVEFRVNTTTASYQDSGDAIVLNDGSIVIIWQSDGQDAATGYGIYMQRYSAAGVASGGEVQVNTTTAGWQFVAQATVLNSGDFVVTWASEGQDAATYGVYMQRYTQAGVAVGGEIKVNTYSPNSQSYPVITELTDGGFVVVWNSFGQDGSGWGIYMQQYDAASVKVGAEVRVNTYTVNAQTNPAVTVLEDGNFVVTWQSFGQDGSGWGMYQRVFYVDKTFTDTSPGGHTINGDYGSDTINGLDGDDILFGGEGPGRDSIFGGEGNDTIILWGGDNTEGGNGNDVFRTPLLNGQGIFLTGGAGYDILDSSEANGGPSWGLTNAQLIEEYRGSAFNDTVNASGVTNVALLMNGGAGNDAFQGGSLNDTLNGEGDNDALYGFGGIDSLNGGIGNDLLNGGIGADSMTGGAGDDTFYVDNAGDVLVEAAAGGTDLVFSSISFSLVGREIENLTLLDGANLTATGNAFNNRLSGNIGNNRMDGGLGADTMVSGSGNDTYVVDNIGDVVEEPTNAGTDLVEASVSYSLAAYVENLTLTGAANINATGNDLNNILTGNSGVNTLSGGLGDDTYYVQNATDNVQDANGAGTDTVITNITYTLAAGGRFVENLTLVGGGNINATGNNLGNTLTGNAGVNVLTGGSGDDTYIVQNAADTAVEAAAQGTDLVQSTVTFTLGVNVENLTLLGAAAINGTGNTLNNVLTGNAGVNALTGGLGNDTYVVQNTTDTAVEVAGQGTDLVQSTVTFTLGAEVENLTLAGAANINGTGNAGNNVLTGNTGTNILTGGLGNDTFYVQNVGDNVQDANGQGTDTVIANVSYSLSAAGRFVEILDLAGSGNIDGTGNNLANTLLGSNGNNVLNGGQGNDTLTGEVGADTFLFQAGSDKDVITDFDDTENDLININAYTSGVVNGGGVTITQSGLHTVIDLGGGNTITVLNTTATDPGFLSHIVW